MMQIPCYRYDKHQAENPMLWRHDVDTVSVCNIQDPTLPKRACAETERHEV